MTSLGDGVLGGALRPLPLRRILAAHAACDCQEFRNLRADRKIVTTPSHAVPRCICRERDRGELGAGEPKLADSKGLQAVITQVPIGIGINLIGEFAPDRKDSS